MCSSYSAEQWEGICTGEGHHATCVLFRDALGCLRRAVTFCDARPQRPRTQCGGPQGRPGAETDCVTNPVLCRCRQRRPVRWAGLRGLLSSTYPWGMARESVYFVVKGSPAMQPASREMLERTRDFSELQRPHLRSRGNHTCLKSASSRSQSPVRAGHSRRRPVPHTVALVLSVIVSVAPPAQ